MADKEVDAVAETIPVDDAAFFADVLAEKADDGRARDEHGRFAPKSDATPEPAKVEVEAKPEVANIEPAKVIAEATPEPIADKTQDGRVPQGFLLEHIQTRERAQAAERKADEAERRFQALQSQLSRQQQQQKPAELPDPLMDPVAYADAIREDIRRDFLRRAINASMEEAHEKHGKDFEAAWMASNEAIQHGDEQLRARIVNANNPGRALMEWHRQQTALREIGGDFKSYQEKFRTETREALLKDPEFRKQVIERARAEAANTAKTNGQSRPNVVELPPSLNRIPAASRDVDVSLDDGEFFSLLPRGNRRA